LLASLKQMSPNMASTCFSPLAILASVWKKWFPTLLVGSIYGMSSMKIAHFVPIG
jgi:hypothetical protein